MHRRTLWIVWLALCSATNYTPNKDKSERFKYDKLKYRLIFFIAAMLKPLSPNEWYGCKTHNNWHLNNKHADVSMYVYACHCLPLLVEMSSNTKQEEDHRRQKKRRNCDTLKGNRYIDSCQMANSIVIVNVTVVCIRIDSLTMNWKEIWFSLIYYTIFDKWKQTIRL